MGPDPLTCLVPFRTRGPGERDQSVAATASSTEV